VFDGLSTPAISYFRLHPTWSLLGQSVARTKPSVRIAGMDLPAKAIKEGNFENVDLTLLSINQQKLPIYLQMRRMPLCEKKPVARRAGHRRHPRRDGALAYHITASASLQCPKKILDPD
jgi:hypothetical protein